MIDTHMTDIHRVKVSLINPEDGIKFLKDYWETNADIKIKTMKKDNGYMDVKLLGTKLGRKTEIILTLPIMMSHNR